MGRKTVKSKRIMKFLSPGFVAGMICLARVSGLLAVKRAWDDQTFRALQQHDSKPPKNIMTVSLQSKPGFIREELTFYGRSGEQVPVLAMIPKGAPTPAIILLYGSGMSMKVADKLADSVTQSGFALFVPEQFGRGIRRQQRLRSWQKLVALRHRVLLTVKETRQLADVVEKRVDVDPRRIYLWGVSFGAMTGCAAMAYDQRFKAAVFTLCGGNLQKIVSDTPYRKNIPRFSWLKVAAPIMASLLRPFDPICHVGRIAPRPLLFQNALNDELIPRSGVDALHQAAGASKKVLWYDSSHGQQPLASIDQLVHDALSWLRQQDREIIFSQSKEIGTRYP